MKDNIERIFKESLEDYAVPYNGAAWDSLSKRLDAAAPSAPFYKKWWFAAALTGIAVAGILLFPDSRNEVAAEKSLATEKTDAPKENNADEQIASVSGSEVTGDAGNSTASNNISENQIAVNQPLTRTQESPQVYDVISTTVNSPNEPQRPANADKGIVIADMQNRNTANKNYAQLSLPETVCLNEELIIQNPNKEEAITVSYTNGNKTSVKAGNKISVPTNNPGKIHVNSGTYHYAVEVVKPENNIGISKLSDAPTEDGIPEIRFETETTDRVTWTTTAAASHTKGKTFYVNPFREMEFEVTATAKDASGCVVSEKQLVKLNTRYNLNAENALNPSSLIPRNRYFMPGALISREVAFDLTIIDLKNGGIVYQTSDASQGWDGTDNRNGEAARPGTNWGWKVVIKNPMPGEPHVYNGVVQVTNNL